MGEGRGEGQINRNFIALVTFAALAGCLALMLYAGAKRLETIGPSRATVSSDGHLFLLSHGKIHVFGEDGSRRQVLDLASMGAPRRPSDFELHRDGRLLITNPDAPELWRCGVEQRTCERIAVALRNVPGQEVLPLNAAKVHIDEPGGRYFISDNAGHRVLITDFQGKLLQATGEGLVRHPNQLALLGPDRLAVVDTDHRRIAIFDLREGEPPRLVESVPLAARGVTRAGRSWPFDSVRLPQGGFAALIAAIGMRDADIVIFDGEGKAVRRAEMPDDADPFDIEAWRGRIWVADASRYRFESVAFDGRDLRPIEDAAFRRELDEEAEKAQRWGFARKAAQVGLVAIPLLGALLLWSLGAAPVTATPAAAGDRSSPIQWLELDPRFRRRARRLYLPLAWGLLALVVGVLAYLMLRHRGLLFSASGSRYALPAFILMALLGVYLFAAMRWVLASVEALRFGATAESLHFTAPSAWIFAPARTGREPWSRVYFDGSRILAGRQLLLTKVPLGQMFDVAAVEAVLVPHLVAGNRIAPSQLTATAWKAGAFRPTIVAFVVALIIGVASLSLVRAL